MFRIRESHPQAKQSVDSYDNRHRLLEDSVVSWECWPHKVMVARSSAPFETDFRCISPRQWCSTDWSRLQSGILLDLTASRHPRHLAIATEILPWADNRPPLAVDESGHPMGDCRRGNSWELLSPSSSCPYRVIAVN